MISFAGLVLMAGGLVSLIVRGAVLSPVPLVILAQVSAIVLMAWARVTFGRRSFHPTATPTAGGVVTTGPYRFIRHPIYASVCLFAWASTVGHWSAFTVAAAAVVTAGAMMRVVMEERAMRGRYPEYGAYAAATKRFVPYIY